MCWLNNKTDQKKETLKYEREGRKKNDKTIVIICATWSNDEIPFSLMDFWALKITAMDLKERNRSDQKKQNLLILDFVLFIFC